MNSLSSCDATLFKYKYEKKQELLDHFKGKRGLDHQGYGNGAAYFGFTGYENLFSNPYAFKHAIPVAYPVHKLVPIPHPIPVHVERPIPIPVPYHLGKALGEYSSSAYEDALANYVSITQDQHYQPQTQYNPYTQRQMAAPVYEQNCHPYCDINLPEGSSPVPLISKEKRLLREKKKKVQKLDEVAEE